MSAGICTSLSAELLKLNIPQPTQQQLLEEYLRRCNWNSYEGLPSPNIQDFLAEVKQELKINVAA